VTPVGDTCSESVASRNPVNSPSPERRRLIPVGEMDSWELGGKKTKREATATCFEENVRAERGYMLGDIDVTVLA